MTDEDNFNLIFNMEKQSNFQASISGYFSNYEVYYDFYSLMKNNGQYNKILKMWDKNKRDTNSALVRHICIGYLENWEHIGPESLIGILLGIEEGRYEICNLVRHTPNEYSGQRGIKVKELWQKMFSIDEEEKSSVSGCLINWLPIFNEIDEDMFTWIMKGLESVRDRDISFFIEHLQNYVEKYPKYVGQFLIQITRTVPQLTDYKKDVVRDLVKTLYSLKENDIANTICNNYAEKHSLTFLRDIYDMNK